ncbi:kinase-like domain-containing protein [Lophiotrema nucula]|uniref:Autophagy-related protein 1 n=1 Tax=Lophiotrema nucula TaxID=690887 RepID=A0A6A5ZU13_9PLEO|nr:kinase-like domain-containing protein [Lophiotrema nucula]
MQLNKCTFESVPRGFIPIAKAGEGACADVFLCLLNTSSSLQWAQKDPLSALVAVKVYKDTAPSVRKLLQGSIERELTTFQFLKKHWYEEGAEHFIQLLSFSSINDNENTESPRWLSTRAVLGSTTLSTVTSTFFHANTTVPEPFIWHTFLQLSSALLFLTSHSIIHGDLHSRNVLLDPLHRHNSGFPNLVIIDFGSSEEVGEGEEDTLHQYNTTDLCDLTLSLCSEMYTCSAEHAIMHPYRLWNNLGAEELEYVECRVERCAHSEDFLELLRACYLRVRHKNNVDVRCLRGRFEESARKGRDQMGGEALGVFESVVVNGAMVGVMEAEERVRVVLKGLDTIES